MRDYGTVSPKFWTGETGKKLRGDADAQVLALYLMTSPHSNMLGVYYCPVMYMGHETGLGIEGASKALARLIEAGFCMFDEASESVFVVNMASFQVAESLHPNDKRVVGIQRDVQKMPAGPLKTAFFETYKAAFHLAEKGQEKPADGSPLEAPCKPHASQEQEQEQDKEPNGLSPAKLPTCQASAVIGLYHEVLPELPSVRLQTADRKRAIRKLWQWVLTSTKSDGTRRAETAEEALEWVRGYFTRARDNDFLMGRVPGVAKHANWRCDLDFLLTDKGMKHVIERTEVTA